MAILDDDFVESYLFGRISHSDYRGIHLAQHNRLPQAKLEALLETIHSAVGDQPFDTPPGDDPKPTRRHDPQAPRALPTFNDYYNILDRIAEQGDKSISATFNSLKKNHFPNFESMGLLHRFNESGEGGNGGSGASKAKLSAHALALIAAEGRAKYRLFGDANERLLKAHDLLDKLHDVLTAVDSLNVYELMLFVSDPKINAEQCAKFVRSYRRLKRLRILELHQALQDRCSKTMDASVSKVDKRDWHNWWNQARQIMTMLNTVSGFSVVEDEVVFLAGNAAPKFVAERSASVKAEALAWHGLERRDGWELHHIFPIDYATCAKDLQLIDSKENLLYIPSAVHKTIPSRQNRSVKFTFDASSVRLINPVAPTGEPLLVIVRPDQAAVKESNLPLMANYSERLLTEIP